VAEERSRLRRRQRRDRPGLRKAQSEDNPPWNDYVIIADGNNVKQWINGVQTVDLTDLDEKARHNSGIFALQIHAGNPMWVEFKDLRLKRLPDTE